MEEQNPKTADSAQQNPAATAPAPTDQASAGAADSNSNSNASNPPSTRGTPNAAPAKRLESISRPSSSTGRGGKAVIAPKPKFAGRRSQTARQEAEQAEAAKKAAEVAAKKKEADRKAKESKRFGYGRGGERGGRGGRGMRQGRGRGGHMGDNRKEEPVASGPFGSGQVTADSRRSGWSSGGGGGGSGAFGGGGGPGGSRSGGGGGGGSGGGGYGGGGGGRFYGGTGSIKTEPGMGDITMRGMPIKAEDGGYISSDDEVEVEHSGPKQNIDQMQIVDLTGADNEMAEQHGLAPVRLTRVPHQERQVGLNVEDEDEQESEDGGAHTSDKKKGKQKIKDLEMTGATARPKRPTAYSSSSDTDGEPHIKNEPTDDDQQTRPTTPPPPSTHDARDATSSPETRRKAKAQAKAIVDGDVDDFPMPPKPKFQTQAEADEWDRKYEDLRQIRNELGQLLPKDAPLPLDADGDAAMAESESRLQVSAIQQEREQGTYIFQFPPVLPPLLPVSIKDDPDNIRVAHPDDAMDVDQEAPTDAAKVKTEEVAQNAPLKLPAGSVGKLRIHKSGKATLDWGGTTLVLGMGTDASFLQTILLARMPEKKPEVVEVGAPAAEKNQEQEPQELTGLGMGQIRGKFVLTPDFDELM